MSSLRVVGVDPGPIPGVVVLDILNGVLTDVEALQCTQGLGTELVAHLLRPHASLLAVERFVVGRGSMRAAHAGGQTRDLVGQLQEVARDRQASYVERSAAEVKPWAIEMRLAGARLLEPTKGMRHARDAAKHALFAAVHAGAIPDPLSRSSS